MLAGPVLAMVMLASQPMPAFAAENDAAAEQSQQTVQDDQAVADSSDPSVTADTNTDTSETNPSNAEENTQDQNEAEQTEESNSESTDSDSAAAEVTSEDTNNQTTSSEDDTDSFSDADIKLLATLIYCEAGNQSYKGQVAVGSVVMNRMKSSRFPDTLSGVIYQSGQFGPAGSGWLGVELRRSRVTESCYKAAKEAMAGSQPVGNAVFFMGVGAHRGTIIGAHVFWGSL